MALSLTRSYLSVSGRAPSSRIRQLKEFYWHCPTVVIDFVQLCCIVEIQTTKPFIAETTALKVIGNLILHYVAWSFYSQTGKVGYTYFHTKSLKLPRRTYKTRIKVIGNGTYRPYVLVVCIVTRGQITKMSYDNLMTYEYFKSNLWQSYDRS